MNNTVQKKLFSGLFWVLLLNLLIKPFWFFGIEVGVQNAVGAEAYGFYFTLFNFAYIFNILLDIGITNFNTRNIAQHPQLIDKHLSGILCVKLLLLALYVVVTFTVGLLLGYTSRQFYLLAFLSFNQFLNSLILYLRSNFEGLLLFKWDSIISILDRVIMILICGALLWFPGHPAFRIEYFVYAQTAAYLLTAATALMVLMRKTGFRRLHFNWPFTLVVLKQSAPFALLVLLMASYNRLDPVLLQKLLPDGDYQAGIYAGAFRLLDALTMVAYLVSVPLLPVYSKLTKQNSESGNLLKDTTRMVFSMMMVFSVMAAVLCYFMADPLMDLLYRNNPAEYTPVFKILVFGIIPISITYVFGTLLTAAGRLRQLNILAACTLLINVAVNLLLIPLLGAVGSAWASLAAQSFMALTQLVAALRIFNLRPSWGYILKLLLFTLVIVGCNLIPAGSMWFRLVLVVVLGLSIAILLKLINPFEIKKIITEKEI